MHVRVCMCVSVSVSVSVSASVSVRVRGDSPNVVNGAGVRLRKICARKFKEG